MRFSSRSAAETKKIARGVVKAMHASRSKTARVLALTGTLGTGKTTFVQGLARALGIRNRVLSPTFILMQPFDVCVSQGRGARASRVWHIDCYRIENPNELLRVGLGDILEDPSNLVVIEWADKIKELLPKNTMWVRFEYGEKENERIITL